LRQRSQVGVHAERQFFPQNCDLIRDGHRPEPKGIALDLVGVRRQLGQSPLVEA